MFLLVVFDSTDSSFRLIEASFARVIGSRPLRALDAILGECSPQLLSILQSRVVFDAFESVIFSSLDVGGRIVQKDDLILFDGGEVLLERLIELLHDGSRGLGSVDSLTDDGAMRRAELGEFEGGSNVVEPFSAMVAHDAQSEALLMQSDGNVSYVFVAHDGLTQALLELVNGLSELFAFDYRLEIHCFRESGLQLESVPQIAAVQDRRGR